MSVPGRGKYVNEQMIKLRFIALLHRVGCLTEKEYKAIRAEIGDRCYEVQLF